MTYRSVVEFDSRYRYGSGSYRDDSEASDILDEYYAYHYNDDDDSDAADEVVEEMLLSETQLRRRRMQGIIRRWVITCFGLMILSVTAFFFLVTRRAIRDASPSLSATAHKTTAMTAFPGGIAADPIASTPSSSYSSSDGGPVILEIDSAAGHWNFSAPTRLTPSPLSEEQQPKTFGHAVAVSADGKTLAVGVNDRTGRTVGHVDLFQWESSSSNFNTDRSSWMWSARLAPKAGRYAHRRGQDHQQAVALSADGNHVAFTNADTIFCFHRIPPEEEKEETSRRRRRRPPHRSNNKWKQASVPFAKLDENPGHFGNALALSANGEVLAVVGESNTDGSVGAYYAKETTRNAAANGPKYEWLPLGAKLFPTYRGTSVALNAAASRMAVNALLTKDDMASVDHAKHWTAMVHVFDLQHNKKRNTLQWRMAGQPLPSVARSGDSVKAEDACGGALAMNAAGDVLAVSTATGGGDGDGCHVQVYKLPLPEDGSTAPSQQQWEPLGEPLRGSSTGTVNRGERFGRTVRLNAAGNILVVGSPAAVTAAVDTQQQNATTPPAGRVLLYEYIVSQDRWSPSGEIGATGALAARFGSAVAFTAAGRRIAVGAPVVTPRKSRDGEATAGGSVLVYDWTTGSS